MEKKGLFEYRVQAGDKDLRVSYDGGSIVVPAGCIMTLAFPVSSGPDGSSVSIYEQ